jgi:hypothetical protein
VEHLLIEPRPVPNRLKAGGLQSGEVGWHHGDFRGRPYIAGAWGFCRLCPMLDAVPSVRFSQCGFLYAGRRIGTCWSWRCCLKG